MRVVQQQKKNTFHVFFLLVHQAVLSFLFRMFLSDDMMTPWLDVFVGWLPTWRIIPVSGWSHVEAIFVAIWKGSHNPILRGLIYHAMLKFII